MRKDTTAVPQRRGEQGFTLIEAMVAMVILIFGVAAVSNLMVVAGTSNTVASHTTAAASVAAQQMELLKSVTYPQLTPGGGVTIPATHATAHPDCNSLPLANVFECDAAVEGVGTIHVQWQITGPLGAAVPAGTYFINVVAQPLAPGVGIRGRAQFTTFRTDQGN